MECSICYEVLGNENNCTTPCGHKFCFNCIMKSLKRNGSCPLCRNSLTEDLEYMSDSSDESIDESIGVSISESLSRFGTEYDGETRSHYRVTTDDSYNITENCPFATPKIICEQIIEKGYSIEDLMILWLGRVDRTNPRYTQSFLRTLISDVDITVAIEDIKQRRIQCERHDMECEDTRKYEIIRRDPFDTYPAMDICMSRIFKEM